jgi:cytochrome c peroxidase
MKPDRPGLRPCIVWNCWRDVMRSHPFGYATRISIVWLVAVLIAIAAGLVAKSALASDDDDLLKEAQGLFQPLPKDMATQDFPVTPTRVRLGRALFFDPRISADGAESCSRCHLPALYATDGLPKSLGVHSKMVPRNAPTVLNAGLFVKEHWDGRFANLEHQAKQALLGPAFGNPDFPTAMARIKAIPGYATMFQDAFPGEADPIVEDNWAKAIGAYERTLVSPSRFDDYLRGKPDALSAAERKGLRTFINTGCSDCHKGPGLGGLGFRKFGVVSEYWKATGSQDVDKGRFEVTNDPTDLYKFKVAGLRNVAMTPPYFHDGAVGALPRAVRIMAKVQLDADLSDPDVDGIVTFLASLTGTLPEGFERAPVLPAGGFGPPASAPSRSQTK